MVSIHDSLIAVLELSALVVALAFVLVVVRWLIRSPRGTRIVAFETPSGGRTYSGKAIADTLASELMVIDAIPPEFESWQYDNPLMDRTRHELALADAGRGGKRRGLYAAAIPERDTESVRMPALQPTTQAGGTLPDISVELGGTKFSLSSLLDGIRQLWDGREPEIVITGTLQTFGSYAHLAVRLERRIRAKQECSILRASGEIHEEAQIFALLRDLAFKIHFELQDRGHRRTETWEGGKHYIEALESYRQYTISGDVTDLQNATKHCLAGLFVEPDNAVFFPPLYQLGGACLESQDYETAARLLESAIRLGEGQHGGQENPVVSGAIANTYNALGAAFAFRGDYPRAEAAFRRAIRYDRTGLAAYQNLALVYQGQARDDELRNLVELARNEGALNQMSLPLLGEWYAQIGYTDDAIESLRHAVDNNPQDESTRLLLVQTLSQSERTHDAVAECEALLKVAPTSAVAHNLLGGLLAEEGESEKARETYARAIALDPTYADPHANLGLVYWQTNELGKATEEFRRALALDPDLVEAHYNLALVYRDLRLLERAIDQVKRLLDVEPTADFANELLGEIYDEEQKPDQAVKHMERALQQNPRNAEARDFLAYLYVKQNRFEEAITHAQQVIADDPDNLRAQAFLAALFHRLGRTAEYKAQLKLASERKAALESRTSGQPIFADEYQEACFEALCGHARAAVEKLTLALDKELRTRDFARDDADFDLIRNDPKFQKLVGKESDQGVERA